MLQSRALPEGQELGHPPVSGSRFLSPSPTPDLARALLPGTRHRNTAPEETRRSPQQRRARAGLCPSCPGCARTCAPGAAGEAATSPRRSAGSPQGQPGFHYITQAALETLLRAIGCRAALPANSMRLCKSSLSQRFLWLRCMQIDVIARVGVPGPGIRGVDKSVWKFAAGLV